MKTYMWQTFPERIKCRKCKEWKDSKLFPRSDRTIRGYTSTCKECGGIEDNPENRKRRYRADHLKNIHDRQQPRSLTRYRRCMACKESLPLLKFPKRGDMTICTECRLQQRKQWHKDNAEHVAAMEARLKE